MSDFNIPCEKCGSPMTVKEGRFGKFLACTGYPECKNTKPLDQEGGIEGPPEPEKTDQRCEKCGSPMVIKHGRYGPFMACTGYPRCRNIKNIEQKTGATCPECGKGDIVAKRSRQGRTFYSCNRYPECRYALWNKPTGEKCPTCGALLIFSSGDIIRCSAKECKYQQK